VETEESFLKDLPKLISPGDLLTAKYYRRPLCYKEIPKSAEGQAFLGQTFRQVFFEGNTFVVLETTRRKWGENKLELVLDPEGSILFIKLLSSIGEVFWMEFGQKDLDSHFSILGND